MPNSGGISTLKGIKYEIQFGIYKILDLLNYDANALRYQPPTTALASHQLPKKIFVDDYSILDARDNKSFFQVKHNEKDASWTIKRLIDEGVLTQMLNQHRNEPKSTLTFISNIPAQRLKNIAKQARVSISVAEFENIFTQQMRRDSNQIIDFLKITNTELWELMKVVHVIHLTEEGIHTRVSDYGNHHYIDTNKFALVLKDIIEESAGLVITRDFVVNQLTETDLVELPNSLNPTRMAQKAEVESKELEEIKSDLVSMYDFQREIAANKIQKRCPKNTGEQIHDDFRVIFNANTIISIIQKATENDIEPLINFFKKFGDILDANEFGLKVELENFESYKSYRSNVAQKRLKVHTTEERNSIIQKNIDRLCALSYGLNSSMILRGILRSSPRGNKGIQSARRIVLIGLEEIETIATKTLNYGLNNIEKEWETYIDISQIDITQLQALYKVLSNLDKPK